jgi:hypothetical protein
VRVGTKSDFPSHVATASSDSEEGDQPPQASEAKGWAWQVT